MKQLLAALVFIALFSCAAMAETERSVFYYGEMKNPVSVEGKAYTTGLMMFPEGGIIMAALDGEIIPEEGAARISGEIATSMPIVKSDGEQTRQAFIIKGKDINAARTTEKIKKTGQYITIITLRIQEGSVVSGDYEIKCNSPECEISVELLGTKEVILSPLTTVSGTAEIRRRLDNAAINITDITRFIAWSEDFLQPGSPQAGSQKAIKLLRMNALPLKKTSRVAGVSLQSNGEVAFASLLTKASGAYMNEISIHASPAFLTSVPEYTLFYVTGKDAKLILAERGKAVVSVREAAVAFSSDLDEYSDCTGMPYSCVMDTPAETRIKAEDYEGSPSAITAYPTGKAVIFDRIAPEQKSASYLAVPGRMMQFASRRITKLPAGFDEFSLRTDFTAMLYSDKDNKYHEYKCLWKQKKCYFDGKPAMQGLADVTLCASDADCGKGESCGRDPDCEKDCSYICLKKNLQCRRISGNGPVALLFVADGYAPTPEGEKEFRQDIEEAMDYLHSISPFDSLDARAAFSVWMANPGGMPARLDGTPLTGLTSDYREHCGALSGNEMNYAIILSKGKTFRAYSYAKWSAMAMPVSGGGMTENDKRIFVHEFGHMFGGLADEYLGSSGNTFQPPFYGWPNCAKDEAQAMEILKQMGLGNESYGGFRYKGCGGNCPLALCTGYIRPSLNSIMNEHRQSNEFNEPSKYAIREKLREATGLGSFSTQSDF